ncbi:DUF1353 domain-containing protein [Pandoraea apista]|uniref:DUF1353 domain-containing protein n=1 Tax=Pandoraea apista TaxID=93218 RepID=A0A5E5PBZ7_9BURK|nr:DUF1353 domain-containing protein [Pandoraea apista]PTE00895.1 hypothetical protein C7830_11715 [Pandoraea apista]RRJ30857.1 DUF1353 domain-containing protein [Pandoraea apista]RRJ74516.1 DUF1353 domain-containing protein [Pandoraea apista]RSD06718.1 DUF1353 domain-containing protein [Pandoraea apista]RSD14601.1 DUF1353 domain-containing protein [Pandoraea apista]
MSRFLTRLVMESATGCDDGRWRLVRALVYQSDVADQTFVVPRGFVTDLASVPRLPVVYWLAGGTSNEAAAVHDWLYTAKPVSRAVADKVLREASAVTCVPVWRQWLMYWGVRLAGASHWR